jgi:hypothetical protein
MAGDGHSQIIVMGLLEIVMVPYHRHSKILATYHAPLQFSCLSYEAPQSLLVGIAVSALMGRIDP